jgi:hypothetical protein
MKQLKKENKSLFLREREKRVGFFWFFPSSSLLLLLLDARAMDRAIW